MTSICSAGLFNQLNVNMAKTASGWVVSNSTPSSSNISPSNGIQHISVTSSSITVTNKTIMLYVDHAHENQIINRIYGGKAGDIYTFIVSGDCEYNIKFNQDTMDPITPNAIYAHSDHYSFTADKYDVLVFVFNGVYWNEVVYSKNAYTK